MKCHLCLGEVAQTMYKGHYWCIACLWGVYPDLKEKSKQAQAREYHAKTKTK